MIAEFDVTTFQSSPKMARRCVWILDLSSTVQDAREVGGPLLLAENETATSITNDYDSVGNITASIERKSRSVKTINSI